MSEQDQSPYRVVLSPVAERAIRAISSRADLHAVDRVLRLLAVAPRMGHAYDPVYDAARPQDPILVFHAGNFGIYYDVDDRSAQVSVAFIEDQRRDPLARFDGDAHPRA